MGDTHTVDLVDDELIKIFVTMRADPDMKMSTWTHAIDELSSLIAQASLEGNWGSVNIYGPDCGAFSYFPAMCAEMVLPAQVVVSLQEMLAENTWLQGVDVAVSRAEGAVTVS